MLQLLLAMLKALCPVGYLWRAGHSSLHVPGQWMLEAVHISVDMLQGRRLLAALQRTSLSGYIPMKSQHCTGGDKLYFLLY
jgi:hypothetical protein